MLFHFTAPSVSVVITPTDTAVVGQSYSLSCSVSGADSLSPTSTYRWYNESSNPRSQVGTTSTYTLNPLRPYHVGQYTCEVTITSPYLNGALRQSMMQDITVQSKIFNKISRTHWCTSELNLMNVTYSVGMELSANSVYYAAM